MVRSGYASSSHPAGFIKSPATESAAAHSRVLRRAGSKGRDINKPAFTSMNPEKSTTASTIIPKKNDPCEFTHTANKGGSRKNHRRSRDRPSCRIKSSQASNVYPNIWGRIARPMVAKNQVTSAPRNATFALPE